MVLPVEVGTVQAPPLMLVKYPARPLLIATICDQGVRILGGALVHQQHQSEQGEDHAGRWGRWQVLGEAIDSGRGAGEGPVGVASLICGVGEIAAHRRALVGAAVGSPWRSSASAPPRPERLRAGHGGYRHACCRRNDQLGSRVLACGRSALAPLGRVEHPAAAIRQSGLPNPTGRLHLDLPFYSDGADGRCRCSGSSASAVTPVSTRCLRMAPEDLLSRCLPVDRVMATVAAGCPFPRPGDLVCRLTGWRLLRLRRLSLKPRWPDIKPSRPTAAAATEPNTRRGPDPLPHQCRRHALAAAVRPPHSYVCHPTGCPRKPWCTCGNSSAGTRDRVIVERLHQLTLTRPPLWSPNCNRY